MVSRGLGGGVERELHWLGVGSGVVLQGANNCALVVGHVELAARPSREPCLVDKLESRQPDGVADGIGGAELGETVRGDVADASEDVQGDAVLDREPGVHSLKDDARDRRELRAQHVVTIGAQRDDRDEETWLNPRRGQSTVDGGGIHAEELRKCRLHLVEVFDVVGFQSDRHALLVADQRAAVRVENWCSRRPRLVQPQSLTVRQSGKQNLRSPVDAPLAIDRGERELAVPVERPKPGDVEMCVVARCPTGRAWHTTRTATTLIASRPRFMTL